MLGVIEKVSFGFAFSKSKENVSLTRWKSNCDTYNKQEPDENYSKRVRLT